MHIRFSFDILTSPNDISAMHIKDCMHLKKLTTEKKRPFFLPTQSIYLFPSSCTENRCEFYTFKMTCKLISNYDWFMTIKIYYISIYFFLHSPQWATLNNNE